jgi:hypothetical protein
MNSPTISLAGIRAAHRSSACHARYNLQQRQCQLSKIALESTFARACIRLTSHESPSSQPTQNDKIVQTSFSESSSDDSRSGECTEDEGFPMSQKTLPRFSESGSSSPEINESPKNSRLHKFGLTNTRKEALLSEQISDMDSFPKPDL